MNVYDPLAPPVRCTEASPSWHSSWQEVAEETHVSFKGGAPGGNRTPDLDVRTVLLYPLSYGGVAARESTHRSNRDSQRAHSRLLAAAWARRPSSEPWTHEHAPAMPRCGC